MSVNNYGGRLGRIIKKYPKVPCKDCGNYQVQITNYLEGDPQYRCRKCKHNFSLPFDDLPVEDFVMKSIEERLELIKEHTLSPKAKEELWKELGEYLLESDDKDN